MQDNNNYENLNFEQIDVDVEVEKLTAKQAKELLKQYIEREKSLQEQAEQIAKTVAKLKAEADEYKDKWVRGAAEFDNYKKRTATSRIQGEEEGKNSIISKILPIGDNLQRALSFEIDQNTKDGLSMLLRSFNELLEKENVVEINPIGQPFDPNFHEAVMQCKPQDDCASGTVREVFLKGYKSGDKVIRYAQVLVVS